MATLGRAWSGDDSGYTSRQHNTHITESREVLYRWHPWYGRTVRIFNTVEKNGEIDLRCALDPLETARVSEVPLWMFDPVAFCHVSSTISPVVTCEALRDLKRLLADTSLAAQANMVQAEHHPLLLTGGADATRDEPTTVNRSKYRSFRKANQTVGGYSLDLTAVIDGVTAAYPMGYGPWNLRSF